MVVTHDFTILDSFDDINGWSGSNDVAISVVSEPKLEGNGAISIIKSGTTETWFYAEYQLPSTADVSNGRLLVFYLYIRPTVISKLDAFRISIYDLDGHYTNLNYDHKLAGGNWKPVIINSNITSGIDWSRIAKIRFIFHTTSSSNTIQEGDIVLDRLLIGSGFYVLYSSETAPDSIEDLARLDADEGLMLVEALNRNMYIVKARIYIGNGTDTGALKISQALVAFDGTDMMQWWDVHLWVMAGSSLIVEDSMLVLGERPAYPHGAGIFRMYETAHVTLRKVYVLTDAPLLFGASHFSFWTGRLETEDILTNFQFSLLRYFISSGFFGILPYGRMTFDDIHVSDYTVQTTVYVFNNAEFVGRETSTVRIRNPVLAGGKLHADAGTTLLIYDPVNLAGLDYLVVTYASSTVMVYYTVDLYILDRLGNPLAGVTLKVYDKFGTKVIELPTNDNGYVQFQLLVYEKQNDSNGNLIINEDYNPFTVEVYSPSGNLIARTNIDVRTRSTFYITPDDVYIMVTWPEKIRISTNEIEHIFVKVSKIDGAPVSGLEVHADIITPDNTTYTISLYEDSQQPGIYVGEFSSTYRAGSYNYRAYVEIGNITIDARNSFDVGIIEASLDEIKDMIRRHDEKLDAYKWAD